MLRSFICVHKQFQNVGIMEGHTTMSLELKSLKGVAFSKSPFLLAKFLVCIFFVSPNVSRMNDTFFAPT